MIDPNRDAEQYVRAAEGEGVRIAFVTETHIHADFVSGSRELAAATGARVYLSGEGGAEWSYDFAKTDGAVIIGDGDTIDVANMSLGGGGTDGACAVNPLHNAICRVVNAGVPVVVADADRRPPDQVEASDVLV